MGIFHEILVAIGIVLVVILGYSMGMFVQDYAKTGHASLAVFQRFHWEASRDPCNDHAPSNR